MAVSWPATLQQKLNQASFGLTLGETVTRSQVDVGPAKVRRRFTKGVDNWKTSIDLDQSEYDTFRTFFDTSLNGGTKVFDFLNPLTNTLEEYRFVGVPNISIIGGLTYRVSMNWEQLP